MGAWWAGATTSVLVSIFGIKIFKDLLDLLCSMAHILRTLSSYEAGEGSCLDGA